MNTYPKCPVAVTLPMALYNRPGNATSVHFKALPCFTFAAEDPECPLKTKSECYSIILNFSAILVTGTKVGHVIAKMEMTFDIQRTFFGYNSNFLLKHNSCKYPIEHLTMSPKAYL